MSLDPVLVITSSVCTCQVFRTGICEKKWRQVFLDLPFGIRMNNLETLHYILYGWDFLKKSHLMSTSHLKIISRRREKTAQPKLWRFATFRCCNGEESLWPRWLPCQQGTVSQEPLTSMVSVISVMLMLASWLRPYMYMESFLQASNLLVALNFPLILLGYPPGIQWLSRYHHRSEIFMSVANK